MTGGRGSSHELSNSRACIGAGERQGLGVGRQGSAGDYGEVMRRSASSRRAYNILLSREIAADVRRLATLAGVSRGRMTETLLGEALSSRKAKHGACCHAHDPNVVADAVAAAANWERDENVGS